MAERYMRFHINIKGYAGKEGRRTTISIERILVELFALKIRSDIETKEGHASVRLWLQERQDEQNMSYSDSGLLKRSMLLEIVDRKLLDRYYKDK